MASDRSTFVPAILVVSIRTFCAMACCAPAHSRKAAISSLKNTKRFLISFPIESGKPRVGCAGIFFGEMASIRLIASKCIKAHRQGVPHSHPQGFASLSGMALLNGMSIIVMSYFILTMQI
ncbi:hypothetical protein M2375_004358 [Comamonas sp. BIGb0152]|uniref:hypothetical protein n=1 Tax=Comamonas sp. BIGb0152 TaxID=2940601 RepID=UPI0021674B5E|nr:hypothetical protein [Comamonas sp. BIGb0152]MCS4296105.1 hypothetical protein [Comamonas sp. BIGb0152]